jgi:DNA polymerase alpha subunit A
MKKIEKRHGRFYADIKSEIVNDKHYCFELDIARGKVEVVKVTYNFAKPPLDVDFEGVYYNGIIGKTYKPQELFVIENRIMGPSWLDIEDFKIIPRLTHSYCQIELSVEDLGDVYPAKGNQPVPKFSAVSVSMVRDKDKSQQIRALVALYTSSYDVESVQPQVTTTPFVFLMCDQDPTLTKKVKDMASSAFGGHVTIVQRERALLSTFVQKLNRLDPDLIIGHDVNNIFYEVLISRIENTDAGLTSSLSRSKRDSVEMKKCLRSHGLKKIRGATFGRMVCDTHLSSLEVIRETNYELDFLAEKLLGEKSVLSFRNASSIEPVQNILSKVDQGIMDAHLSLRLCQRLQLVQLNKQLTNVSGCFWYQSFQNLRAERNEMLLMHTFNRNNFIFPDKYEKKYEEGRKKGKKREKAGYAGGLVLEPKSGLYKDFILLLDFNSLYPSIIREFKICFTTVRRSFKSIDYYEPRQNAPQIMDEEVAEDDEEANQEEIENTKPPAHDPNSINENDKHLQILPKIIHQLIKKRQDVKNDIKRITDPAMKDTLDIKQKAYKLVANSIYGCLGFKNSRFFAQEMAALITEYGRSLLTSSAAKVTELGYDVVYGDTDSLMINSRVNDLSEALAKGYELKKEINNQYRSRGILEIDVDGIFRSLLLLKKKKYAADKLQNLDDIQKSKDISKARFGIELKGLDIVRRDWSGITKNCGKDLVDLVLANDNKAVDSDDDVVSKIYEYLARLKEDIEKNRISTSQYTIFKQLNKSPKSYNDKGQPHVVVAKRMQAKGFTDEQLVNHFIPYIICKLNLI